MSTPSSRRSRLYVYVLVIMGYANIVIAAEQTNVREYTYQASEADSKLSARAIALQEVKRALLSELGTHVSSLVKMQSSSDGTRLDTEEIETLSAGVTRVEILDEKWNGAVYVLKAQIKADPEEVLKSLHEMLDADKKQKQLSQLGGDLSKIRTENIQIAESLTQSKKETTAALAEIARLKQQLEEKQTDASRQTLQTAYQQQVDQLTLNEWFESALKYYKEGDYQTAFRLFKKVAEQGLAQAQFNLGLMYYKGDGVTRDAKQAVYWFQKAAEQGESMAQYNLGVMYDKGEGVTRDAIQAVYWYQKAAEQGIAIAQFQLGVMYEDGKGVPKDDHEAIKLYRLAAENGYAKAQLVLGNNYFHGRGVPQDDQEAVKWFRLAAAQGHTLAQGALGLMYDLGRGVPQDFRESSKWYRQAAEEGDAIGQYSLSLVYLKGNGLPQNYILFYMWINIAASNSKGDIQMQFVKLRDSIAEKMMAQQI